MINIAIDGHAGSGKSTITEKLSKRLGYKELNTGAIYRGIACRYRDLKLGEPDEKKVEEFVKDLDVEIYFESGVQQVVVNGKNYTKQLRGEEISNLSSNISQYLQLREKVLDIQRTFAAQNDCIMEGRDIGTIVLPNATIKFFITAPSEIRAKRRYEQLQGRLSYQEILNDIKERDYSDEHRKIAPLKVADDAIIIDNGNLTEDETIEICLNYIKLRLEKRI